MLIVVMLTRVYAIPRKSELVFVLRTTVTHSVTIGINVCITGRAVVPSGRVQDIVDAVEPLVLEACIRVGLRYR